MKRTDFTQNFPGGIIKGDSRCREGEEMEEKINLNVCRYSNSCVAGHFSATIPN